VSGTNGPAATRFPPRAGVGGGEPGSCRGVAVRTATEWEELQ